MKDLSPDKLLEEIRDSITEAKDAVASGKRVNMSIATKNVEILCDAISMMLPKDAAKYEETLKQLTEDFRNLSTSFEAITEQVRMKNKNS